MALGEADSGDDIPVDADRRLSRLDLSQLLDQQREAG